MRQMRKQMLTMLALLAGFLLAFPAAVEAGSLVTTIVTDPLTGVALDGYDPVTYFTEVEPLPGTPDNNYDWGGVTWYFASAANRDVFVRAPQIYAPQFGGHCAMSLARGYLSDGKPRIYLIDNYKIYLFYSSANRDAFQLSMAEALQSAGTNWPGLSKELMGPSTASGADAMTAAADPAAMAVDAAAVAAMPAEGNLSSN